jgi:SulP family sulfate permease
LNVPALGERNLELRLVSDSSFAALSLGQEVDLNRELVAHGYSNLAAGLCGTVYVHRPVHFYRDGAEHLAHRPNYEVYINSVLFYRIGGGTRLSGLLLAFATIGLLLIGTAPIGFIRA